MKKSFIYLIGLVAFASCTKEAEIIKVEPVNPDAVISVLKDNSGFDTVFNVVKGLSTFISGETPLKVVDFSLETNNNFNIVYTTEEQSQQSLLVYYYRFSKNLTTQAVVPLPQYADDLKTFSQAQIKSDGLGIGIQQFKPYSNFFTYAITRSSASINFLNSIEFKGDIVATIKSGNPVGESDVAYYYPVGNIAGAANKNNAFGYFTLGTATASYLTKICNPYPFVFLNNSGFPIIKTLFEPRQFAQGTSMAFTIRPDSLIAAEVNSPTYERSTVTRLNLNLTLTGGGYNVQRHYSVDGKILSILLNQPDTKKYWTYTYNFTTKILAKGQEGILLDYSGEGSDIDFDEFGNIYYSGYAANGTNKVGVSIYKKGIDGQTTRIGADDFLKFGTIIKLKVLMGKVYFALNGKKTGFDKYQLSVLKQQ